ncbi:MAG TPA: protoporphyrinogen oxidase [Mycobacteriales bacterium]|nr:protoporphyrinogen oxidase [Mycobacteriales bacterium]
MRAGAGYDVVVIGAGIAGLAAAHALSDLDVLVIDGAKQVGGKLRTSAVAGLAVDEGAETFLARVPEAIDLVTRVGLGAELVHPTTTSAAVWARGGLRPIPRGTVFGVPRSVRSFDGILRPDEIARAGLDLVLPPTGSEGDESVRSFVQRRLGAAVVDRLVDPLLGGVYAGRAEELSVRATAPQLAGIRGSLIRGVARTPAPSTDAPVFATVRAGLATFAAAVASASGADLLLGRLVRRLERTPDGFRVVHGPTPDEQVVEARAVVVAVPAVAASRLLREVAPAAAGELGSIDAASMAIVTTAWRRSDLPELAGSGYLVPAVSGRPVKAVTFASAKWAHLHGDVAVVRCSIGRYGDTAVLHRDDAELVALAADELRETVGFRRAPVEARVTRWGGALPQYAVGHLDRVRRIRDAVSAVPGLAVCGATYEGVGIPACIRTGQHAAAQVRARIAGPTLRP